MSGLIYATTRLQRKTPEISTLSRNPLQPIFNYGQNTIAGDEHGQIPPAYTLPEPRFSFDFSKVPVHSKNRELMHGTEEVETTDRTDGPKAEAPKREPIMSVPVSVDRIDIIDSPKGAIGGFPPTRGGDLNVPGPLNK